jgi:hypothetical protein
MRVILAAATILLSAIAGSAAVLPAAAAERAIVPLFGLPPESTLRIAVPAGLCEVRTEGGPGEKRYHKIASDALRMGNTLLAALFVDCAAHDELAADNFSPAASLTITLPLDNGAPARFPGRSRQSLLDEVAGPASQNAAGATTGASAAYLQRLREFDASATMPRQSLGLLAQDEAAVYTGAIARQVQDGQTINVASVGATTLLKDQVVTLNFLRNFEDTAGVPDLVDEAQLITGEFVQLNEDGFLPVAEELAPPVAGESAVPDAAPAPAAPTAVGALSEPAAAPPAEEPGRAARSIFLALVGIGLSGALVGFLLWGRKKRKGQG